ncbi:MAG: glycosyltransferase family 4 protein [Verrucomicrobiia bacterium]|jgi:UDP-glucose:(heptosyl)LPS alpha-1,3-glucosyltransferase
MKLALIRRKFSATGGAELYLQRLLGALREHDHELHLFTESWESKPADVELHPISINAGRHEAPLAFAAAAEKEVKQHQFDCVFSLERTIHQDVYRAGDGVHKVWLQRRRQFAPWWRKPFVNFGAFHRNVQKVEAEAFHPDNTRHIIVNSEMVRGEILDNFDFPPGRIHLIRNGIDVQRYQSGDRKKTRKSFGIHDDDFVMLFVGSGWERKGLKYLIRAYEQMSGNNVKVLVVGKGRKPMFANEGVIYTGPIPNVEAACFAADLLVFLPIYEPCSNVVSEALAADLPVVTTVMNGAHELIREGRNGSVIHDPRDTKAVVNAIEKWRANRGSSETTPDDVLSLDRNVRETVEVLEMAAAEKKRL